MNEATKAEIRKRLGNISQLRELLLGDKINEYDRKLEQYHIKLDNLELNLQQSQTDINQSIAKLESKLLQRMEAIAKILLDRIIYHSLETKEKQDKLQQELDALANYSHDNIDLLQKSFNTDINSLKIEIAQSKLDLDRDLSLFKQELLAKLETHFLELANNKISRTDLAEVLFELSIKLKETDIDPNSVDESEAETLAEDSDDPDGGAA